MYHYYQITYQIQTKHPIDKLPSKHNIRGKQRSRQHQSKLQFKRVETKQMLTPIKIQHINY